jgi:hypothetical protein
MGGCSCRDCDGDILEDYEEKRLLKRWQSEKTAHLVSRNGAYLERRRKNAHPSKLRKEKTL